MIFPTPEVPAPPKPPDPPIPPAPPEITTLPGGLPSLLYVNPPPPAPAPDASRGGMVVNDRVRVSLDDIDFRPGRVDVSDIPGVELMPWGAEPRPKPPPVFVWTCPDCQVGHWESAVILQQTWLTTMMVTSFYDKANNFHVHDPNIKTSWYVCTRGHRWSIQESMICPDLSCIWPTVV